ncbi:hypothetical protein CPB83DRAFT_771255 [Crepidotus variabilis]|uniref:PH domain-containing protein n=1 Tax=Crepidotus variabilis TaxID=179855 RepID=A0A9P6JM39_9AGAR|nr:hypothetical protein CPB83DRAFT_771255 [Crepidotus variabilis]
MPLRSQRSLHRPSAGDHQPPEPRVPSHHSQEFSQTRQRSLSLSRSDRERRPQTFEEPVPPLPHGFNTRPSIDETDHRVLKKSFESRLASTRTSTEVEQDRHRRPSVSHASVNPISEQTESATKQRVFIHSLQHFHSVGIGSSTSAGDLIAVCEKEGVLDGWAGIGSWMVWEISQDFGMERPVRDFEQLADVQASWLKDKTVNYFLLKKSTIAGLLSRSTIPSTAPTHSGYIEWESKRGKWSKRWLRLKENGLYISKRDNGRDETLLCSLSNFDAYYITRSQRSPKPFPFAVKSTDNLSFFENTADYMHNLSCSEKDGQVWIEKILTARSFVLHEERQVLFNPRIPSTQNGLGASLSRSGTRKTVGGRQQQPFLALPPSDVFQPGSLLSQPGP